MEVVKVTKRAVLYARVSSELQKKERTVDSQVLELKKQIQNDGNTLVKEYVDEGYSGAQLDRPAMDQLRNDLKQDIFDIIYIINTDRIAREVTYQIIIVAEILKYKKQVIINGKDYEQNPENKFALTVLGAVAELERAKITERVIRGKAYRLSKKLCPGAGTNVFGYDYVRKTRVHEGYYQINEREAETIRFIFNEFINTNTSLSNLTRKLEKEGYVTKKGNKHWERNEAGRILSNYVYLGTMYFNKMTVEKEYANPIHGTTKTTKKVIYKDKSEWIGIPVPQIISQEMFDKAQEKRSQIRTVAEKAIRTRKFKIIELLSGLIVCGSCNNLYTTHKRTYDRPLKRDTNNIYTFTNYVCIRRVVDRVRSRCPTKQITSHLIEDKVWKMFDEIVKNEKYKGIISEYSNCTDFDTKRAFLLKYITKIIHYDNDSFVVYFNINGNEFEMSDLITKDDRHCKRLFNIGAITTAEKKRMREGLEHGRAFSISQGIQSGGFVVYGYNYIHKTKTSKGKMVINEEEAEIVRSTFNEYLKNKESSVKKIANNLNNMGYKTKRDRKWCGTAVSHILKNYAYTGTMYFNKTRTTPKKRRRSSEPPEPKNISHPLDRSKWIEFSIPKIISKDLFEKVQEKIKKNRTSYRHHLESYLLSDLIECGVCGSKYSNHTVVYKRPLARDPNYVCHTSYYVCTHRQSDSLSKERIKCDNKQVTTTIIEEKVLDMFTNDLTNPETLRIKVESPNHIPQTTVDFSIRKFCYKLQMELEEINSFEVQRNLFMHYIDKIIHNKDSLVLHGYIPIEKSDTDRIEYRIKRTITIDDRHRKRLSRYKKNYFNNAL